MSIDYAKRIAFIRRLFLTSLTTTTTRATTTNTATTTNHSNVDLHISQNIIMINCFTQNQCDFHLILISYVLSILAEIEAIEACKWLRAAGFPQYAQMYEGTYTSRSIFYGYLILSHRKGERKRPSQREIEIVR